MRGCEYTMMLPILSVVGIIVPPAEGENIMLLSY